MHGKQASQNKFMPMFKTFWMLLPLSSAAARVFALITVDMLFNVDYALLAPMVLHCLQYAMPNRGVRALILD